MKLIQPSEIFTEENKKDLEGVITGSDLNLVFKKSLAHWKYAEKKESSALDFGIASHAMILDSENFDKGFVRGLDIEEYPDALRTTKDLQAWLKSVGQKSSGSKAELTQRVLGISKSFNKDVHIWDLMIEDFSLLNSSKTIINPIDYDKIHLMRDSIVKDDKIKNMISNGLAEHTILGKLPTFKFETKVRPDLITKGGHLVNYKTARDIHPDTFGKHCYDYGYLLRASLEWDMFTELYGRPPDAYIFLAQEKESPFVWKPYYITQEQLSIGRVQRTYAQSLIENAIETGKYSSYGTEPEPLELPVYITNKYEV